MEKLKPYPKYKPVNLPWLKEIPAHWSLRSLRQIASEHFISNKYIKERNLLSLSYGKIIKKDINITEGLLPLSFDTYQVVEKGNVIIRPTDLQNDHRSLRVGLARERGIITSAYIAIEPSHELCPEYLYYLLHTYDLHKEFYRMGGGMRQSLKWRELRKLNFYMPSLDEQKKIVAFLDEKTAKIDKYIEAKHRYFELILEKLVSKIFRKSLSKKIASWSSLFPDKWERKQVKRLFEEVSLKGFPEEELAAVTQDRGVVLKRDCSQNYVSPDGNYEKQKLIRPNDFVISLRSFEGGIEYSSVRGLVSSAYNIFCLREKYNNKEMIEFYRIMFKSKPFISLLNTFTNTIRDGKDISFKDISRVELPIPDKKFLNDFYKRVKIYRITVSNFEKIRKLLIEYKTRLISDAVTGKIKV